MHREAEGFQHRLNALRDGASPAYIRIIDKMSAVINNNQTILRNALACLGQHKPSTEPTR